MKKLLKSISLIILSLLMAFTLGACQKKTDRLEALTLVPIYWPVGIPLPEASAFVKDLPKDVSVRYVEEYRFSDVGVYPLSIILTDEESGAELERTVQFSLLIDSTPPNISGVKEISASLGKPVLYKNGITVSDNCSAAVTFSIDNSQADLSKEGSYTITYIAVDAVGNETRIDTTLHVYETEITQDMLYKKLDPVISQIITSNMNREEQCRAVYRYV